MHSLKKGRSIMDKDITKRQVEEISCNEQELMDRRDFLHSLKKWSKIVIGGALAGSVLLNHGTMAEAAGWANRGGGGGTAWANRGGGGGTAWANRGAGWANRGSAWVNRF
jgi:hypothetical protein